LCFVGSTSFNVLRGMQIPTFEVFSRIWEWQAETVCERQGRGLISRPEIPG
jgi:hypothetical protein